MRTLPAPRMTLALLGTALLILGCIDSQSDPLSSSQPSGENPQSGSNSLQVGSTAPPIDIEHWVQNDGSSTKGSLQFELGKVYVVEFWATWCPPCVSSMPHLVSLQKQYASQGVQIVSISNEPIETVQEFLDGPYRGDSDAGEASPSTFRQLTSAYSLTTDPDGSAWEDYLTAAGIDGIPSAFLVGKSGKIEWIGHPMELDSALAKAVAGP